MSPSSRPSSSTAQIATSIDPNFTRPYTNEYSFGIDRELMANTKFSAVYTYRQEKNTLGY